MCIAVCCVACCTPLQGRASTLPCLTSQRPITVPSPSHRRGGVNSGVSGGVNSSSGTAAPSWEQEQQQQQRAEQPQGKNQHHQQQPQLPGGVLYPTHVPLGPLQRAALAALAAAGALARPARGDLVAVVGEAWGAAAARGMRDRMRADPEGRRILAERPRVTVRRGGGGGGGGFCSLCALLRGCGRQGGGL